MSEKKQKNVSNTELNSTLNELVSTLKQDTLSKKTSGIPGMDAKTRLTAPKMDSETLSGADSYTERTSFKAFHTSGRYFGTHEAFGGTISDRDRLFYSTREPVGVWWVKGIAYDIWDNGFRVLDKKKMDDETLNDKVQDVLRDLETKSRLPQETVYERRYGTSILLLSYTGFGDETDWKTPLFTLNVDGKPPKTLKNSQKLLQITPYPWTEVTVSELDENSGSLRFGLPMFYKINTGAGVGDSTNPSGQESEQTINVHWTRVIHDAPRLDEHAYEGVAAIDCIFDDLVGGRNARWAAYQDYYRHGGGFPVIKTNATAEQNKDWVESGGLDDYMHRFGYFLCHVDEDFKFVGAEGKTLNPNTYFDMYFTFIAAATGVAKDTIKGVSAGRVTGSEVNERQYYKSISLQQNQKIPFLRELIDRIIQTGQVEFDGEYVIEWVDPFEVNPQDKAAIEFMKEKTNALKTYMTVNERRALENLPPLDGPEGEMLMLQPGQNPFTSGPENQQNPVPSETEPEEPGENESSLLDTTIGM